MLPTGRRYDPLIVIIKLSGFCPKVVPKLFPSFLKFSQSCLKITKSCLKLPQDTTRHCIHCFKVAPELEIVKHVWYIQFDPPKRQKNLKFEIGQIIQCNCKTKNMILLKTNTAKLRHCQSLSLLLVSHFAKIELACKVHVMQWVVIKGWLADETSGWKAAHLVRNARINPANSLQLVDTSPPSPLSLLVQIFSWPWFKQQLLSPLVSNLKVLIAPAQGNLKARSF